MSRGVDPSYDPSVMQFAKLLPYVLPAVPTCSNMLAVQNIRRAAIDLCQESRIWRETMHPLPLGNESCEYEFEPPTGAERVRLEWVTYEGRQLEPTTEHQLRKCDNAWTIARGQPNNYLEMNTNTFRLWPAPHGWFSAQDSYMPPINEDDLDVDYQNKPCAVLARISLRPSIDATAMDALVLQDHYSAIVNGALSYLYFTPGHPWTNPELGMKHEQAFSQGIDRAKYQAVDGNVSTVRTTSYGGL